MKISTHRPLQWKLAIPWKSLPIIGNERLLNHFSSFSVDFFSEHLRSASYESTNSTRLHPIFTIKADWIVKIRPRFIVLDFLHSAVCLTILLSADCEHKPYTTPGMTNVAINSISIYVGMGQLVLIGALRSTYILFWFMLSQDMPCAALTDIYLDKMVYMWNIIGTHRHPFHFADLSAQHVTSNFPWAQLSFPNGSSISIFGVTFVPLAIAIYADGILNKSFFSACHMSYFIR